MNDTKVFRAKADYLVVGVFLCLLGAGGLAWVASQALSPHPIMVGSGRGSALHPATRVDLLEMALAILTVPAVGIGSICFYRNASVTLDQSAVTVRGGVGQTKFQARYAEITKIGDIRRGYKMLFFTVEAGTRKGVISNVFRDHAEIRDELLRRAPA